MGLCWQVLQFSRIHQTTICNFNWEILWLLVQDLEFYICQHDKAGACATLFGSLSNVFGPKKDGITGDWKRERNEESRGLCSSPNINRAIKPRRMKQGREAKRVLVGKPEVKRQL